METNTELTPKERAKYLWLECYPEFYDNGNFMKSVVAADYAKKIARSIIKETLHEYTNDENHVRVEYWREVLSELENWKH